MSTTTLAQALLPIAIALGLTEEGQEVAATEADLLDLAALCAQHATLLRNRTTEAMRLTEHAQDRALQAQEQKAVAMGAVIALTKLAETKQNLHLANQAWYAAGQPKDGPLLEAWHTRRTEWCHAYAEAHKLGDALLEDG